MCTLGLPVEGVAQTLGESVCLKMRAHEILASKEIEHKLQLASGDVIETGRAVRYARQYEIPIKKGEQLTHPFVIFLKD